MMYLKIHYYLDFPFKKYVYERKHMPSSKALLKIDTSLSSEESLYALLGYEAGFNVTANDITLNSITPYDSSADEEADQPWNTVLTLNVIPTSELFKHTEATFQRKVIRLDLEDWALENDISVNYEDDLTLFTQEYALAKTNQILKTNFTADQVVITLPDLATRAYTPDSMQYTFEVLENKDVRFFGSLNFQVTDAVDRRPSVDEVFPNQLLSGFEI